MDGKIIIKHIVIIMGLLCNHEFCTADLEYLRTYQKYQSSLHHWTTAAEKSYTLYNDVWYRKQLNFIHFGENQCEITVVYFPIRNDSKAFKPCADSIGKQGADYKSSKIVKI